MDIQSEHRCFGREWKSFIDRNSNAIFQIALLLAATPQAAEDALIASVDELDVSKPPQRDDLLSWEMAIVKLTAETPSGSSTGEGDSLVRCLIQPGLRPLMRIAQLPRICFVLQLLLGYGTDECANLLRIEESEVAILVAEAAVQLERTAAAANCR